MNTNMNIDPNTLAVVFKAVGEALGNQGSFQKSTGAPVGPYIHGPGGLFGVRGLKRGLISTHTQITGSLGEIIPIVPAKDMNPLFPFITGFLRSDQQEKDGVCDVATPAAGPKTCIQTAVFGRKEFKTPEIEVNEMGKVINRGEFTDLMLENSPLVNQMAGLMRNFNPGMSNQQAAIAGNDVAMRFLQVAIAYQRWLCPTVYTGHPSNNAAGGGYKEFMGLDLLIGRNKVDALTGTACPSLYSDVKDFGYRQVDDTDSPDIVVVLSTMLRILKSKARQQNLAPVDFRLVMRDELFYALTRIWPCRYITDRCSNIDGDNIDPVGRFSVEEAQKMRDSMYNGKYLTIEGLQYPVVIDDCISEENYNDASEVGIGGFASDIYILPFTARGGTLRTLYWEYRNYRADVLPQLNAVGGPKYFWSDDGVFLWTALDPTVWCIDWQAKMEPRLILRTPQLAGRLTNVAYTPLQHTDDPLPSQDYHVNGGVSTGYPTASPFSEFNPSGPGIGA